MEPGAHAASLSPQSPWGPQAAGRHLMARKGGCNGPHGRRVRGAEVGMLAGGHRPKPGVLASKSARVELVMCRFDRRKLYIWPPAPLPITTSPTDASARKPPPTCSVCRRARSWPCATWSCSSTMSCPSSPERVGASFTADPRSARFILPGRNPSCPQGRGALVRSIG